MWDKVCSNPDWQSRLAPRGDHGSRALAGNARAIVQIGDTDAMVRLVAMDDKGSEFMPTKDDEAAGEGEVDGAPDQNPPARDGAMG